MPKVLIIDDDEQICKILSKIFRGMDYDSSYQLTLKEGLNEISSDDVDVLFLDVNLPDGNGLEAIEIIKRQASAPEIIIITADEDVDGAELAMRSKAWDYISKRGSYKNFKFALDRAYEYRKQKQSKIKEKSIQRRATIGESRLISRCLDKVSRAANNDLPILITGETGTGKELFSRAIHNNSKQSQFEFVVVDCTSLPEHLVESTLFGHTKGAFTGADSDKTGLLKMADKGTLFLDEVGELPLSVQKKFLRALQEKQFRPVGSKKEVRSDFRLICATHRDLTDMIKKNQFREDLFFRMFSMNIHLPPLKDRESDIEALALHRLSAQKDLTRKNPCTMSPEFLEELQMYEWPGNVRELINTMYLVSSDAGDGSTLFPHHLPGHIRAFNIRNKFNTLNGNDTSAKIAYSKEKTAGNKHKFKAHMEKTKYEYLSDLLSITKGNIKEACRVSGLSKSQLYRFMRQNNLKNI
ncbi:MAG: sigma-54 dependent transcriptional regulator [Desulfobacula sp.]|nr:sigma-54 dependent transcriptional regulator [Desulfobacula sp.]